MKLKLTAVIALTSMLITSAAGAAALDSFTINDATGELVLAGTPEGTVKDDSITIQLLKQGKTSADINTDTVSNADFASFVHLSQVLADENGGYEVIANMEGEDPGFYWVRVNGEDVREIYFSSKANREAIVSAIKENCSAEKEAASITYLKTNFDLTNDRSIWANSFDISAPMIKAVTEDGLFKAFLEMLSDLTIDNVRDKMELSAYIAALNENKADVIDYKEEFSLDAEYVEVYNANITNGEAFVSEYFAGKDIRTVEDIQKAFNEAVLKEWCNSFDSWEDPKTLIEGFGSELGVDMEDYEALTSSKKTQLYVYLAGIDSYSTAEDFANKANLKMTELLKTTSSGGSGGSSGGGGGGGSSSGSAGAAGGMMFTPSVEVSETVPKASEATGTTGSFSDLEGFDWAKEAIEALAEKGIVSGTGEGKYEPEREVKREEILAMILRAFEIEAGEEKSDFTDAAADGWYTGLLAVAKEKGFISGRPDGTFGVGDNVTREDVCVMAYNIAKAMSKEFDTAKGEAFADDSEISEYAADAVYALKNAGIVNGKGERKFAPKATCTRAEAAKIIYTLLEG